MKFVNLTPHIVKLNDGREFPPSGTVARISSQHVHCGYAGEACLYNVKFEEVEGLPAFIETVDVIYIVSGMVAQAVHRRDVVSPATGHPDCVRVNGQVVSVPGFVTSI